MCSSDLFIFDGVFKMKLTINGRKTNAFYKLIECQNPEGATVTRRLKGYCDIDVLRNLVSVGYIEAKQTGPRGGTRYFITEGGKRALSETK